MSRSTIRSTRPLARHALLGVAAAAGAAVLLSGCSAGQITQTSAKTPSVPGLNAEVGDIAIRNAMVAFPPSGSWPADGAAQLSLRLVNVSNTGDRLIDVKSPTAGYVQLVAAGTASPSGKASPDGKEKSPSPTATGTPTGSPTATPTSSPKGSPSALPSGSPDRATVDLEIPAAEFVSLEEGGQRLVLQNLEKPIRPGDLIEVTFTFERAGAITVKLPVAPPATPLPRQSPSESGEGGH